MSYQPRKLTLGFVPANRGGFSDELAFKMRNETVAALERAGIGVVVPSTDETKVGCVENRREAEVCADLFRKNHVQGILIGAANFGDEQAVAWTVRQARLDVPIMIFGCQEEAILTPKAPRRDSFCGLLSIADALRQLGLRYTVAQRPICFPSDASFATDLDFFGRVCRVVNGIRNARYGQIGARPDAFWACRYDEKKLQRLGPTAVVLDLSEAIGGAKAISDSDPEVERVLQSVRDYADTGSLPQASLLRGVKLEVFLRRWREANDVDGLAIQCWRSLQSNYGVCSCATMARFDDEGWPSACEADILGTLSMHASMLASGRAAALADWNNLHSEDDELANLWHCGVFPASLTSKRARITAHEGMVTGGGVKPEIAGGTIQLVADPSPMTLCRVTQDPDRGWKAVLAQGQFEANKAETWGSYGWCRIPGLQRLYRDVLLRHFPHHVAITQTHVANVLWEALGNYLGMDMYHAAQETPGLYSPRLPF